MYGLESRYYFKENCRKRVVLFANCILGNYDPPSAKLKPNLESNRVFNLGFNKILRTIDLKYYNSQKIISCKSKEK